MPSIRNIAKYPLDSDFSALAKQPSDERRYTSLPFGNGGVAVALANVPNGLRSAMTELGNNTKSPQDGGHFVMKRAQNMMTHR